MDKAGHNIVMHAQDRDAGAGGGLTTKHCSAIEPQMIFGGRFFLFALTHYHSKNPSTSEEWSGVPHILNRSLDSDSLTSSFFISSPRPSKIQTSKFQAPSVYAAGSNLQSHHSRLKSCGRSGPCSPTEIPLLRLTSLSSLISQRSSKRSSMAALRRRLVCKSLVSRPRATGTRLNLGFTLTKTGEWRLIPARRLASYRQMWLEKIIFFSSRYLEPPLPLPYTIQAPPTCSYGIVELLLPNLLATLDASEMSDLIDHVKS
ncbi:hypothetical protein CROQUDRAFT_95543 [Cronartium quercuum f. sp. fusiforme G11]|uniref:Uncharacterized protein n=1 Tax=Cronartium quercuum f. sp. fusiforme G11 TaxID=708437 RepID=A0A9P6T9Y0_9BASI|nr:hypothetical protein CROQUDRAFT_95543 [Cronartium quercuum f. sp. fusiforme G11]